MPPIFPSRTRPTQPATTCRKNSTTISRPSSQPQRNARSHKSTNPDGKPYTEKPRKKKKPRTFSFFAGPLLRQLHRHDPGFLEFEPSVAAGRSRVLREGESWGRNKLSGYAFCRGG